MCRPSNVFPASSLECRYILSKSLTSSTSFYEDLSIVLIFSSVMLLLCGPLHGLQCNISTVTVQTIMSSGKEGSVKGKYGSHTFEWKIHLKDDNYNNFSFLAKISQFFNFCGYYCQLYCNPKFPNNMCYIDIGLNGYPAPFYKNISSYYSLSLISSKGKEQFTKQGRIHHFSEENINVCISDDFRVIDLTEVNNYFSICFSWCEDDSCTKFKQVMSSSDIGCSTQTEDSLSLNEESSKDVIDQATQTESNQSSEDISIIKENRTIKFLEILSRDLGSFYESQSEPDCVLNVDESKFPVHRSLLSARSTVFAAMFHHDTSESRSGEVNIPDADAAIFGDVIYYMYTGKVRGLSPDTAAKIYTAADKYALIELRDECLDFLKSNLTIENVCDAAVLSHSHAEVELENEVVQFIKRRLHELMGSENWKLFSDKHYKIANKLLCTALIAFQTGKI